MVVDDDADIRDSIGDILELRGYRVTRAANGRSRRTNQLPLIRAVPMRSERPFAGPGYSMG